MTNLRRRASEEDSVARRCVPPPLPPHRCLFFLSLFLNPNLSSPFPSFSLPSSLPPSPLSTNSQEPGSACRNFVAQIREQQKGIAESTCANPVTVSTKPTAQCCELALTFTPCKCDDDVARVSGRMLAIATYRATQFACQGKCVEPQSVGCKGK